MDKIVLIAVAVIALQVLSAGADSADAQQNSLAGTDPALFGLDVIDKAGSGLSPQSLGFSNQIDVTGILKALQNVLDSISKQIENTSNAISKTINDLIANAQTAAQNNINGWNRGIQDLIDGARALGADITRCEAQQETLQDVSQALTADLQVCVQQAAANVTASFQRLSALEQQAQELIDQVARDIDACSQQPLFLVFCLAGNVPGRLVDGAKLAASATTIAARIAGDLVISVPVKNGICVTNATHARAQEAGSVIANITRCVQESTSTSSTSTSSPTAAP